MEEQFSDVLRMKDIVCINANWFFLSFFFCVFYIMKSRQKIRKNRSQRPRRLRGGALSETVYVVLENGELYPNVYSTYELARQAVLTKYADQIGDERTEFEDWGKEYGLNMASQVDIDENQSGTTNLYIEREINITIQRYTVPEKAN